MGCNSSITVIEKPQILEEKAENKKETILIEVIAAYSQNQEEPALQNAQEEGQPEVLNTKMKKQKEKIQFLQESQTFMRQSVEISNYVQQAILSLTYNPLLHDQAYYKLIGMNKKTIQKKQNRMNNLLKREEKAEMDLKKERQKRMEKTKSEIINYRFNGRQSIHKESNKENRDENLYHTLSKQSFAQKMSKAQLELLEQPSKYN